MALNYILNVPNSEGGYDRIPALKGDKGDKGDRGATGLNGAYNPNILINSNFAINQRGESSYTGNNVYTVDMWRLATNDVTLTKLTNGIGLTISASKVTGNNYFLLQQKIEDYAFYANKKVTATIKYSNNVGTKALNLRAGSTNNYSDTFTATSGEFVFTFTLGSISTSLALIVIGHHTNGTAETINIEYIKLELGENATEYTPPQLASEKLRAFRYFRRFKGSSTVKIVVGYFVATTTTGGFGMVDLGVSMRGFQTMSYADLSNIEYINSTDIATFNTFQFASVDNNYSRYTIYGTGSFVAGTTYLIRLAKGAYLDFSAEL